MLAVVTVFMVLLAVVSVAVVLANETNKVVSSGKGFVESYWECELDEEVVSRGKNKTVACSSKMSADLQKYLYLGVKVDHAATTRRTSGCAQGS